MKSSLSYFMLLFFTEGVFGEKMSVSVKEGDSVTLSPELSEIKEDDVIDWRFGDSLIARVRNNNIPSVYEDALDEKFRDRLNLNGQTGDLTITNFRNTDAGDYEVSNSINTFKKTFSVSAGVFGDKDEVMSVMKGNRVTLNTGVAKDSNDTLLWYFEDTLIALVNRNPRTSCLYYGKDEIFKDRLEVDYKTGSLTITTSRPEHTGRYQAEFIEGKPGKTKTVKTNPKCDHTKIYPKGIDVVIHKSFSLTVSGPSPGVVAGIVVAVLLLAAAVGGVMIYRRRSSRNDIEKNKQNEPDQESQEGLMA